MAAIVIISGRYGLIIEVHVETNLTRVSYRCVRNYDLTLFLYDCT